MAPPSYPKKNSQWGSASDKVFPFKYRNPWERMGSGPPVPTSGLAHGLSYTVYHIDNLERQTEKLHSNYMYDNFFTVYTADHDGRHTMYTTILQDESLQVNNHMVYDVNYWRFVFSNYTGFDCPYTLPILAAFNLRHNLMDANLLSHLCK